MTDISLYTECIQSENDMKRSFSRRIVFDFLFLLEESKASNVESRADQNAEHCSENADKVQTGNKNADHGQSNSEGNQFTGSDGVQVLEVSGM